MQPKDIVPGADYRGDGVSRRCIGLEGASRHERTYPANEYTQGAIADILEGIQEGVFKGFREIPVMDVRNEVILEYIIRWRDLTNATITYLEEDLTTPHEMPIAEFAEWAEERL